MPLNQTQTDLLNRIQTALGPALSPSLTSSSADNDIFEAYVFSLVIEAARTEGANVTFEDVTGSHSSVFTFRTSPGYIFSVAHDYTHAILEFNNKPPLEAHVGVYVSGKSNVIHECDVAVISNRSEICCTIPSLIYSTERPQIM